VRNSTFEVAIVALGKQLKCYRSLRRPGDPFEIEARIGRLNEFWGGKMLSDVNAQIGAA